jgi:hypothetical protein
VYISPTTATSYTLDLYVQYNVASRAFGVETNVSGVREMYNPVTILKLA